MLNYQRVYYIASVGKNNPQSCLSNPSILLVKVPKYGYLEEQYVPRFDDKISNFVTL